MEWTSSGGQLFKAVFLLCSPLWVNVPTLCLFSYKEQFCCKRGDCLWWGKFTGDWDDEETEGWSELRVRPLECRGWLHCPPLPHPAQPSPEYWLGFEQALLLANTTKRQLFSQWNQPNFSNAKSLKAIGICEQRPSLQEFARFSNIQCEGSSAFLLIYGMKVLAAPGEGSPLPLAQTVKPCSGVPSLLSRQYLSIIHCNNFNW